MGKDALSKIRAGDVWKEIVRVLDEYRIGRGNFDVLDKRPHPILTVRYAGQERSMPFAGTPSSRRTPANTASRLRKMLREMQMSALGPPSTKAGAVASLATDTAPASSRNQIGNETMSAITDQKSVSINGSDVEVVEYKGQRVITFAQIDRLHGRAEGTAKRNFSENAARFEVGTDFVPVSTAEIRKLFPGLIGARGGGQVFLITRRGYLKIVKSQNDDGAWTVFEEMLDRYFAIERLAAVGVELPSEWDRLVGMTKMLAHKVTETERMIEAIFDRIQNGESVPAFDLAGTVTALKIIEMAGVPTGHRVRGTSGIVTRHMKDFCLRHGYRAEPTPEHIDQDCRWRFPREAAMEWLITHQGTEIVVGHVARQRSKSPKAKGQMALSLVGKPA